MTSGQMRMDRDRLLVVRVEDQINPTLTGRSGVSYDSPPQPPDQALVLVRLLLGCPTEALDGQTRWRCPLAGGTRTVTLETIELTANGGQPARAASGGLPRTGR